MLEKAAFSGLVGIARQERCFRGLALRHTGHRNDLGRQPVAERDGAGLVEEQRRAVAGRLEGLERTSVERGAVSATRKLLRVCQGRIALVGDASGSVDAITGEGLCLSFRQALVLSECLASSSLDRYQARHRSLARRPALMSRLMLTLEGREWFRRRVMQAFVTQPRTFARMLALHVGVLTPLSLAGIGLSLGWDLWTI